MTPEEFQVLETLRAILRKSLESKSGELQTQIGGMVAWELKRYMVEPAAYPSIGLAEKVMNPRGEECIAGFVLQDGKPAIVISLNHAVVRNDPAQLLMSIFHEFHHFLSWRKDPSNYEKERNLPGDHPIEILREREALEDLRGFVKQLTETGNLRS
jgi:hypothetical protein